MTKQELVTFIREEALKLAFQEVQGKKNKIEYKEKPIDFDSILFNGGDDNFINESTNSVQVTTSEIGSFEKDFKTQVSPLARFDKQENNYSLFLYNGEEGMEARASGNIKINTANEIVWRFSLQEGADIKASLKLTDDNYTLITKLYDFFQTWQKTWKEKLSGTQSTDTPT